MLEHTKAIARPSVVTEIAGTAAYVARLEAKCPPADRPEMKLDLARTALVVIDPHTDLLSPKNTAWAALGGSGTEGTTVRNLGRLFSASKFAGIAVAISLTAEGFIRSGFLPELRQYVEDKSTIICSPHKRYSPLPRVNDIGVQLRRQRVGQVILAGLIANLRLESHLRDLIEQGFEIAVVRDAIAGPKLPDGDGYLSTLINFRRIANALWTTEQAVKALGAGYLSRLNAKESTR